VNGNLERRYRRVLRLLPGWFREQGAAGDRQLRLAPGLFRAVLRPGRPRLPGALARAWSRRAAGSGVWSLTLVLLAAEAGAYRLFSLSDYLNDSHLISGS
jgi:hypothetical protein